jgi:hypothetical protein
MYDVGSEHFRRSLRDVVRWCATLPIASEESDSNGVQRRNALLSQADQLIEEARRAASHGWRHRKIQDTAQWASAQQIFSEIFHSLGPIETAMRSLQLSPSRPLDSSMSRQDWSEAVGEVVAKRPRLVDHALLDEHAAFASSGRLLLYWPEENLACGAAQVGSRGFYDADNVPPWDIWVAYEEGVLISWVPPGLIGIAQMGIDANPEGCIQWIDQ